MAFHQINGIKIHTSFDYPPIPVRQYDWSAVDDNYDADCDQDGFFSNCPIGHGATEQEAIDDLLEQIEAQGDTDPDPYGEKEIDCECDGEGCEVCSGCGTVFVEMQPVTLDDLDQIGVA